MRLPAKEICRWPKMRWISLRSARSGSTRAFYIHYFA